MTSAALPAPAATLRCDHCLVAFPAREAVHDAIAGADRVFCYSGGVDWNVAEALASLGEKLTVKSELSALADAAVAEARVGDQLLVMSNGAFGGIHAMLLERLRERTGPAA